MQIVAQVVKTFFPNKIYSLAVCRRSMLKLNARSFARLWIYRKIGTVEISAARNHG